MATRDYKTKERLRPRPARRGGSGFFWFVTGAVVGAFGVGLAWTLQDQRPPPAAASPRAQAQAQAKPPTKPRFVFHRLLPELKVQVPNEEVGGTASPPPRPAPKSRQQKESSRAATPPKPRKTAKTEKPKRSTGDGASYLVQVASLRKASDAEQLKARLALLGIRSSIQQVTVKGKDYHRVRAGPYRGRQEVNKTRTLLSSNGLQAIAIRLK
ncbi:SPOR domain-containing protein [Candidatus Thiosymbion oneisti]|uniref:SPOR domain-containing protein n=1 Tax=Candidatus Thiosymbion oneisti TaxID=589554 RepID=UPI00105BE8E0|nr:SPOR domain-containing protein [Candidatus Thiosymbion oneisti]